MLNQAMGYLNPWTSKDVVQSKARLRCMTPDHWPIVGPMPDIEQHKTVYPHLAKDKHWKYDDPAPVKKAYMY